MTTNNPTIPREELALHPEHNDDMVKRLGRVGTFAPGNYISKCMVCQVQFVGDKRALNCLPCAVSALRIRPPAECPTCGGAGPQPAPGHREITEEMVERAKTEIARMVDDFYGDGRINDSALSKTAKFALAAARAAPL